MKGTKYYNAELEAVVSMAKNMGLKVWTFESSTPVIRQVFFDNGETFGTASAKFSGITYGTCHKAGRECGTGFSIGEDIDTAEEEKILETLQFAPGWAMNKAMRAGTKKESFEQHTSKGRILKYYEL